MRFIDIFESDYPQLVLNEYCSHAKPGADKVTYKAFKKAYDENISIITNHIRNHKYKFTRFELFLKVKKHYKLPRLIFKSTIRDRFTTKLMSLYMQEFYNESGKDYSTTKTRDCVLHEISTKLNAKGSKNEPTFHYFLRLDISNYFDSINKQLLINQLREDKFDEDFLYLTEKLFYAMDMSLDIPLGTGVPQGISVSSVFAERYLRDLDIRYSTDPYEKFMYYVRYVDDIFILFSTKEELNRISRKIIFDLQSFYGLTVNNEKVQKGCLDSNDSVSFLGTTFKNRSIYISPEQEKRVENQLDALFLWYRRICRTKKHPFYDIHTDVMPNRALNSLITRLNLLITGYIYEKNGSGEKKKGKFGWILTSLPNELSDVSALKTLDRHVCTLINAYIDDEVSKESIFSRRKSFYKAYYKSKYKDNADGYILDRDKISLNKEEMYRLTCDLSFVDLKFKLNYDQYNEADFEEKVGESLKPYFFKTLFIANRNLTEDILYW